MGKIDQGMTIGDKANKRSKNNGLKRLMINALRLDFFILIQIDRYHASRAPASFVNAIGRFRVIFFGFFKFA